MLLECMALGSAVFFVYYIICPNHTASPRQFVVTYCEESLTSKTNHRGTTAAEAALYLIFSSGSMLFWVCVGPFLAESTQIQRQLSHRKACVLPQSFITAELILHCNIIYRSNQQAKQKV